MAAAAAQVAISEAPSPDSQTLGFHIGAPGDYTYYPATDPKLGAGGGGGTTAYGYYFGGGGAPGPSLYPEGAIFKPCADGDARTPYNQLDDSTGFGGLEGSPGGNGGVRISY